MPLVPAKCPNCGGDIKIDSESRAGICEFCKNPFVAEDAINNYNTYNQNSYNIANAEVHIHDEKSIEQKLEAAEIFFTKHHDISEATRLFTEVSKEAPGNYQAWWGLVRVFTIVFLVEIIEASKSKEAYMYAKRACAVAPTDQLATIKKIWNNYVEKINRSLQKQIDWHESQNKELDSLLENLSKKGETIIKSDNDLDNQIIVKKRVIENNKKEKVSSYNFFNKVASGTGSVGLAIGLFGCCASVVKGDTATSFILGLILLGIAGILGILGAVTSHQTKNKIENLENEVESLEAELSSVRSNLYSTNNELNEKKKERETNIQAISQLKNQIDSWNKI